MYIYTIYIFIQLLYVQTISSYFRVLISVNMTANPPPLVSKTSPYKHKHNSVFLFYFATYINGLKKKKRTAHLD